jgi:hypothetical protein
MKELEQLLEEIEFEEVGPMFTLYGKNYGRAVIKIFEIIKKNEHPGHSGIKVQALAEFLLNIYQHAHKKDCTPSYSLSTFLGRKGWVARIRDSSEGFDYEKVNRERIHQKGGGVGSSYLKMFDHGYEKGGAVINIKFPYKQRTPKTL